MGDVYAVWVFPSLLPPFDKLFYWPDGFATVVLWAVDPSFPSSIELAGPHCRPSDTSVFLAVTWWSCGLLVAFPEYFFPLGADVPFNWLGNIADATAHFQHSGAVHHTKLIGLYLVHETISSPFWTCLRQDGLRWCIGISKEVSYSLKFSHNFFLSPLSLNLSVFCWIKANKSYQ